jgi:hypothetical protein
MLRDELCDPERGLVVDISISASDSGIDERGSVDLTVFPA